MEVFVTVNTSDTPVGTRNSQRVTASRTHIISTTPGRRNSGAFYSLQLAALPSAAISTPEAAQLALLQHRDDLITQFWGGRPEPRNVILKSSEGSAGTNERHLVADRPAAELTSPVKHLFFLGIVFFPFWIVGIVILCSPLEGIPGREAGRPGEEGARRLRAHRDAEVRWGRRCLWAMLVFLAIWIAVALVLLLKHI